LKPILSLIYSIYTESKKKRKKILDIFRKNIQKLSGKLSGKTENITLVSIDTRQVACMIKPNFNLLPRPTLINFWPFFSRKFQSFSGKLLSEFQKIPNLNIHLYLSISSTCSCRISAFYLLPRPTKTKFWPFSRNFQSFTGKLLSKFQKIPNLNNRFFVN
jgi:hypothetical protein